MATSVTRMLGRSGKTSIRPNCSCCKVELTPRVQRKRERNELARMIRRDEV